MKPISYARHCFLLTSSGNYFWAEIAADLRKRRPKPHTTWHLDEVYLKIDGRLVYCAPAMAKERF